MAAVKILEHTNILHLTDLHLVDPISIDQEIVLDALKTDLLALRGTDLAPDLIVFSGDISAHASAGQYERVLDLLIELADAVGLSESKIVLVPGNHDASRSVVEENRALLSKLRTSCVSRGGANSALQGAEAQALVSSAFAHFQNLAGQFAADAIQFSDLYATTYFFRHIAVVAINTACLTGTGLHHLDDRGVLAIPEHSLHRAIKAVPAGVPIVVVGHHPPEWLNDECSIMLRRIMSRSTTAAYLCGHLHEAMPVASKLAGGEFFVAQSGALYGSRDYWNGYAVISITSPEVKVMATFRRWYESRREFSCAEDLTDRGVFFPDSPSREYWSQKPRRLSTPQFEDWRRQSLVPAIEDECGQTLSNKHLDDVFVTPEFERDSVVRREGIDGSFTKADTLSFDWVCADTQNIVISASKESGKTTILRMIAAVLARQTADNANWSAPILLNFTDFSAHLNRALVTARRRLPAMPEGYSIEALIEQGRVTFLVDDVDFRAKRGRDNLVSFMRKHARCRFILSTSTHFLESATLLPEISPDVPFVVSRLRPMKQSQLLSLIQNHGVTDPLRADQLLNRVVRDASALNLPLTAVTGTFLIQILRENPEELPVHQAALIERYIELLLQKFAPRELLPSTFNFRNKVDLLSVIAERMTLSDEYAPEENVVLTWIVEYLAEFGLDYSARDIFSYVINSRLWDVVDGRVRFRLRMFFEFFVASRMRDSEDFRNRVFEGEKYLSFGNEVSFYSALTLRDGNALQKVFDAYVELDDSVAAGMTPAARDGSLFETFVEPNPSASAAELLQLERQVKSDGEVADARSKLLDDIEVSDGNDQSITRPTFETIEDRWLAHLILASAMLKHTELVPDQLKRRQVSRLIDGWIRFSAMSVAIVGQLALDRKVTLNGVTYRLNFGHDVSSGELARRLALAMPIGHFEQALRGPLMV